MTPMQSAVRILVLEDDPDMLETLCEVLEDEGYEVDSCSAGDQAVAFAQEKHYDLLIADIRMEGLDGLGALSQVQSYQPDVGSLVVTGYASDAQNDRANRLGLNGFLEKPFELGDLLDTVDSILETRRQEIRVRQREDTLLSSARWSTEWAAHVLEKVSQYQYRALAGRARCLGQRVGLDGVCVEQVALAALMRAAQHNSDPFPTPVPEAVREQLSGLAELWDGTGPQGLQGQAIPLPARVISVALAAQSESDLASKWPGRFDPLVLSALEQVGTEPPEPEQGRGLLEVGRALLEVGDFVSAQKALQDVVNQGAASPLGVEATLELARLRQRQGDHETARRLASRAPELASHFGPQLAARTCLRSALLLARLQSTEMSGSLLQEAVSQFRTLGMEVELARCELALSYVKDEPLVAEQYQGLARLLGPEHRAELIESTSWLVPLLLRSGDEQAGKALVRVATQFPNSLTRSLELVSAEARRFALSVLAEVSTSAARGALTSLAADPEKDIRDKAQRLLSSAASGTPDDGLTLHTLGRFEVVRGDVQVPMSSWKSSKVRYLLAWLAATPGNLAEEVIWEQFWPGDAKKARKNLNGIASNLRKTVRITGVTQELIVRSGAGLALNPDLNIWHDLSELRKASARAKAGRDSGDLKLATAHYRRVFALFHGPYLEDCYMDWALEIQREVQDTALEAATYLARAAIAEKRYGEALECARAAVRIDPCLQEAQETIMRSYLGLKRPSEAIRQYEQCKAALTREFSSEPSIELERLYHKARLSI